MRRRFLPLLALIALASPALAPVARASRGPAVPPGVDSVVVFVVRHAGKVADGSRDPPLTATGRARAAHRARVMDRTWC